MGFNSYQRMLAVRTWLRRNKFKKVEPFKKWKILTGDKVEIVGGRRDFGKQGIVRRVDRRRNRVVIEGLNLVRKHIKGTAEYRGTIVSKAAPVHYSKVQLVDPTTGLATRAGFRFLEDGTKVRVAYGSGNIIPKPENLKQQRRAKRRPAGPKDTTVDMVREVTFHPISIADMRVQEVLKAAAQGRL